MSIRRVSDASLATDDLVLWTGFITGIIGTVVATVSLIWQLLQWRSGRKERKILTLNANVLKPWSEVVVSHVSGWPDGIDLFVPKNAFPVDMVPKIANEGIPVSKVTGIFQAQMYLRERPEHSDVFDEWVRADQALREYNDARRERHRLVETMVAWGMAVAYPNLNAATSFDYPSAGSYWAPQVVSVVERMSLQFAAYGKLNVQMSKSTTMEGGEKRWNLSEQNSMPLLFGVPESLADDNKMRDLLLSWIQDSPLKDLNVRMINARAKLEQALDQFRTKLREVCLEIDQSGG